MRYFDAPHVAIVTSGKLGPYGALEQRARLLFTRLFYAGCHKRFGDCHHRPSAIAAMQPTCVTHFRLSLQTV